VVGDKARIGVVGAGWWVTENHIPLLEGRADVELAAVCRRSPEKLRRVKERFGFGFATEDYREMLEKVQLDGVIVGSPHDAHYEHAKAALEKDLHVLVEKPLALRAEDARELVRIAEQRDRQILIPYGWNFRYYTREASRLVNEGAIGEVEHVVCQMASARRERFSGDLGPDAGGSLFRSAPTTWVDPERGGGYGWGQLVHALSLFFRITDIPVRRVFALMGRSPTGVDLYDAVAVSFEGDATGLFSGAATVPEHRGYQLDLRVFGSEGMMLFDIERERLEVRRHDRRDTVVPMRPGDGEYACVEPVERFAEICLGRVVENDGPGGVGARAVEVLEAAYRSARSGRVEELRA
jgi:predicted dehydrogenase